MYYLWCKQTELKMKHFIDLLNTDATLTTVETSGTWGVATFQLSNRFIREYTKENRLNWYETEYGSGIEKESDLDTYIKEELRSIVEHMLENHL